MDKTIKITFAGLVGILAFMLAIGFVSAQEENFNEAKKLAKEDDLICITGSFYVAGKIIGNRQGAIGKSL